MAKQNAEREGRRDERTGDRPGTALDIREDLSSYSERDGKTQLTTQPSRRKEYRGPRMWWKIMVNNPLREDAAWDLRDKKAESTNSPDNQMCKNAGEESKSQG